MPQTNYFFLWKNKSEKLAEKLVRSKCFSYTEYAKELVTSTHSRSC